MSSEQDRRTDGQLIKAIDAGSEAAFEALYRRYRDWVINMALRFTGNRDLALEVMQETFIYLLGKFPGFQLTARFTTFLYPVVKHLALNRVKRERREGRIGSEQFDGPVADTPTPADTREELARALAALSPIHREVVLLRFVDELPLERIAAHLDLPVGTVKSRLHHAVRQLRSDPRLGEYFRG